VSNPASTTDDSVADTIDDVVDDHPWLERVFQIGWLAKGVVYTLMGFTATQIAQQDAAAKGEASPAGSIALIADVPVGRLLLAVLTIGLSLYTTWRLLSVAIIRGNDVAQWGNRIGYTFSGLFYLVLGYTAGRAAYTGVDPEESNTVERLSASVMEMTGGRTVAGLAGVVTICVGLYFAVHKGVQRSFVEDLTSVRADPRDNEPKRAGLVVAGVIGWIGRGYVTVLVGFFVLRAAVRFDADEARGFDRSLRQVAGTGLGSALVLASAVGLIAYGVFCFVSYRFRTLSD